MASARRRGSRVRVTIVDDNQTFVYALTSLLTEDGRFEVVATAGSAADVIPTVDLSRPDLLLLDILMPGGNGLDLIRDLCHLHPQLTIVVLTGFDDANLAWRSRAAGAAALVAKGQPPGELLDQLSALAPAGA